MRRRAAAGVCGAALWVCVIIINWIGLRCKNWVFMLLKT